MRGARTSRTNVMWSPFVMLFFALAWFSYSPTLTHAQCTTKTAGFNGVYGCSSTIPQGSFAFVDADAGGGGSEICVPIQKVLQNYATGASGNPLGGVVVDARGFTSGNLTCQTNPWSGAFPHSSVVLFPAGTITLSQKLVMPPNTRLVGAGSGVTILVPAGTFEDTDMIDMGGMYVCPSAGGGLDCEGVVIEHLALQGGDKALTAIRNQYSQELSYVNDVAMSNLGTGSTGLWLDVRANASGPYTNIRYSGAGTCAQIYDFESGGTTLVNSRGIHGLTCIMTAGTGPAIYVDAPNNSLEDVYIQSVSSQDGILVGSRAPAYNNAIFNVSGNGLKNVVHISNQTNMLTKYCGATPSNSQDYFNVCDVTILGVTNVGTGNLIEDDLTTPSTMLAGANLGMYIVGEPVQGNSSQIGYSRFTTSPSVPTWLVGTGAPSGSTCTFGSLYSRTSGGTGTNSIYACTGGSNPWAVIK